MEITESATTNSISVTPFRRALRDTGRVGHRCEEPLEDKREKIIRCLLASCRSEGRREPPSRYSSAHPPTRPSRRSTAIADRVARRDRYWRASTAARYSREIGPHSA